MFTIVFPCEAASGAELIWKLKRREQIRITALQWPSKPTGGHRPYGADGVSSSQKAQSQRHSFFHEASFLRSLFARKVPANDGHVCGGKNGNPSDQSLVVLLHTVDLPEEN